MAASAKENCPVRCGGSAGPMMHSGAAGNGTDGPSLGDASVGRSELAICDANPILADQLLRILQADDLLSARFRISIVSEFLPALRQIAADILILDPTQDSCLQKD
jgi:hypothetical protein